MNEAQLADVPEWTLRSYVEVQRAKSTMNTPIAATIR